MAGTFAPVRRTAARFFSQGQTHDRLALGDVGAIGTPGPTQVREPVDRASARDWTGLPARWVVQTGKIFLPRLPLYLPHVYTNVPNRTPTQGSPTGGTPP
jgi:hypothetical protein